MNDNTTGLTAERWARIKTALADYGGLTREEGKLLVDRIDQLERRCNELLESEAYAAGVIELLRGMVDGEAFDICEEFTEQRHSSVAPIVTVRRERDEARTALDDASKDHRIPMYWRRWRGEKMRADRAESALERVRGDEFAEKIAHAIECCGAIPRGDAEQGAADILALIRDETGDGSE